MYPKYSASAAGGAQPTPQPESQPPPPPPPPRARLSSFEIDRQFEARLRSLSPAPPVSLFLPAPRDDELQQRFKRLQAGDGSDGPPVDEAELERRLKRLQGEDEAEAEVEDGKHSTAAASVSPHPRVAMPVYAADAGDELETLLREVQDEVKLDYKQVYDTALQLTRPLDSSELKKHRGGGGGEGERKSDSKSGDGKKESAGVDVNDVDQLMHELQCLPDTAIVKLKHAAGSSYHSDDEHEHSSDDEG